MLCRWCLSMTHLLSLPPALSSIWDFSFWIQFACRLNLCAVCLVAIFFKFLKKLFASRLLCDSCYPFWRYLHNMSVKRLSCVWVSAVLHKVTYLLLGTLHAVLVGGCGCFILSGLVNGMEWLESFLHVQADSFQVKKQFQRQALLHS